MILGLSGIVRNVSSISDADGLLLMTALFDTESMGRSEGLVIADRSVFAVMLWTGHGVRCYDHRYGCALHSSVNR